MLMRQYYIHLALGHKVEPNPKVYTRKLKHPKEDDPEETEYMKQWSSGFLNGLEESLCQSTCPVKKKALKSGHVWSQINVV